MKKTEDCSHRTQSNPMQSMDGSNPCPTLNGPRQTDKVRATLVTKQYYLGLAKCRCCSLELRRWP